MTLLRLVAITVIACVVLGALVCGGLYYMAGLFVDDAQAIEGLRFGLPAGAVGGCLLALVIGAPIEWLLWRMRGRSN